MRRRPSGAWFPTLTVAFTFACVFYLVSCSRDLLKPVDGALTTRASPVRFSGGNTSTSLPETPPPSSDTVSCLQNPDTGARVWLVGIVHHAAPYVEVMNQLFDCISMFGGGLVWAHRKHHLWGINIMSRVSRVNEGRVRLRFVLPCNLLQRACSIGGFVSFVWIPSPLSAIVAKQPVRGTAFVLPCHLISASSSAMVPCAHIKGTPG